MATVVFFALAVLGLGALTLATAQDLIDEPGLGALPGALAMIVALAVFSIGLAVVLRAPRPRFVSSVFLAFSAALAHLVALWLGALIAGAGPAAATAIVGRFVLGGASALITVAALLAAFGGIAARRSRSGTPRWPWEGDGVP
ncbi:hypothetical protein [Microbacterium pseudoresistens]|uniref:Uncharacterized protein n=1 Tax=Microbacterium pseudoresistens TaxID=640634 RepID=A0A7Y9JNF8_9MICO|nr:hypothetical protein [Microbacterium pseudoresistens]NYD54518.1 hypothetical protein [Microbacterium pseudoresistens]